jgi:hypothetical protein
MMNERLERIQFAKEKIIPFLELPIDQVLITGSTADGSANTRWKKDDPVDIRVLADQLSYFEHPEESVDGVKFIVYTSNYSYDKKQIDLSLDTYYPRVPRIHEGGIIIIDLKSHLAKLKSLSNTLLAFPPLLTEEEIRRAKAESRGEVNTALSKLNRYTPNQFDQFNTYIEMLVTCLYKNSNEWRPRSRNLLNDLGRYSPELRNNWHELTKDRENAISNSEKLEILKTSYRIVGNLIGKSEPPKSIIRPKASQPL